MIALVFLHADAQTLALAEQLESIAFFNEVHRIVSKRQYDELLGCYPLAISFLPALPSIVMSPANDWIAIGDTDKEALSAYQRGAQGFLTTSPSTQMVTTALKRVMERFEYKQRQILSTELTQGLCEQYGVSSDALTATLKRRYAQRQAPSKLGFKTESGCKCICPNEIQWIEAAGDYMCINTTTEKAVVRTTLIELISRLDDERFVRCNRSVLVNNDYVSQIEQTLRGMYFIVLTDGTRLKISRRYFASYWNNWSLSKSKNPV